ncbi:PLD nuclease N-terminal domain-containing protein [Zafaria sp. Z1313]|uniref:PLD nuclease N-terminal domain-containing protein n=1 Tax=unclassified Zafaria TaxID=2828765 RepID=UPI002E7A2502|nr:PLD nuclease N-terminal domain-containing protein [Zafaria sp. J156]MEE1621312.1 PLD nuclease N-terminal domain-containing protein [Zafaria sp. J156]
MVRNIILASLVALAITIYALIECIRTRPQDVRSISKPAWILAIVLLPLIGAGLWFWLGRPRFGNGGGAPGNRGGSAPRPSAPDDDTEFLRNLERQRRQQAREEGLRRKEAELKAKEEQLKKDKPQDPNQN